MSNDHTIQILNNPYPHALIVDEHDVKPIRGSSIPFHHIFIHRNKYVNLVTKVNILCTKFSYHIKPSIKIFHSNF